MSKEKLENALVTFVLENPFYASLILQMNRIIEPNLPAYAGVSVDNLGINLYVKEELFKSFDKEQINMILMHECLHVVFMHSYRGKNKKRYPWELACELAVNSLVPNIEKRLPWTVNTDTFEMGGVKFQKEQSADYYYDQIDKLLPEFDISLCDKDGNPLEQDGDQGKQDSNSGNSGNSKENQSDKKENKGGSGNKEKDKNGEKSGKKDVYIKVTNKKTGESKIYKPINDPDKFNEEREKNTNVSFEKEMIKKMVEQAYNKMKEKQQGNIPGNLERYIVELLSKPQLDWRSLLRNYFAASIKSGVRRSWKRPSRRFGGDYQGKIPDRVAKVAVAIDTSGSIGEKELAAFCAEIEGIQRNYRAEIDVIECDYIIQNRYKLNKFQKPSRKPKGGGGTSFVPVFKELNKTDIDVLIYLTDTYGDFPQEKPRYEVIWVSTAGDSVPFGKLIKLDLKQ